MMATIGYKAQLYGSMTKLKFEISYTQYQIKGKKKLMGIAIFDAMQNGDHKGAEVREQGKLFGQTIFELTKDGGWYQPNGMMLLPPSAFFLIAFIIWAIRTKDLSQCED